MKNHFKNHQKQYLFLIALVLILIVLSTAALCNNYDSFNLIVITILISLTVNIIASILFFWITEDEIKKILRSAFININSDDVRRIDNPSFKLIHFKDSNYNEKSHKEFMLGWLQMNQDFNVYINKLIINKIEYLPDWTKIANKKEVLRLFISLSFIPNDNFHGIIFCKDMDNNLYEYDLKFKKVHDNEFDIIDIKFKNNN